jgi:hypothetical protein
MKKPLLVLLLCFFAASVFAQNDCNNGRYKDPIFPQVLVTPGIPFGAAKPTFDTLGLPIPDSLQQAYPLFMDVYQPLLDTGANAPAERPVIVFAFGGSFVYGARVSPDIVQLCNKYAQLGYVAISIDYRLSDEILVNPTPENVTRAVLKGVHDMRAAVRFVRRQYVELNNIFRIDTNQIYVGGVSAGAFCAIHTAYLDKLSEVPPILMPAVEENGGLEGNSGNPGYSSAVKGVINLCGAIGDTAWIDPGDVPIVSMHGTADATVPYDYDTVRTLGINYPVHGSASIHRHLDSLNNQVQDGKIKNAFYTWIGAGHVPFLTDTAYFDTTYRFTRDFMYELVCQNSTGIQDGEIQQNDLLVFPNPARGMLKVATLQSSYSAELVNLTGQVVLSGQSTGIELSFDVSALPRGMYILRVKGRDHSQLRKVVLD